VKKEKHLGTSFYMLTPKGMEILKKIELLIRQCVKSLGSPYFTNHSDFSIIRCANAIGVDVELIRAVLK